MNLDSPGSRLKALRLDRGMTGLALAEDLGVTKSTISYWEAGRTDLPWSICLALEALYGVSSRWLARGEDPMWLPALKPSHGMATELIQVPFLTPELGFTSSGKALPPHPKSLSVGLPQRLFDEILGRQDSGTGDLFFWRVEDAEMTPLIPKGSWVLLDVSTDACLPIQDHEVYLLRLSATSAPILRRLACDPLSNDLIAAADAPGRVPLRLEQRCHDSSWTILGKARWVGHKLY